MYRILIVDDDKIEREGIKFLLTKYSFPLEIVEAKHGRAALEYLREHEMDILLTDIKMPFMDGLQLASTAGEIQPQLKILILSGHEEFAYAKVAISLKVCDYLLKPIEPDCFCAAISSVICQLDEERAIKLQQLEWLKAYETGVTQVKGLEPLCEGSIDDLDMDSKKRAIKEVLHIIEKEYDRDLSLEYLSKQVHLSASYLSHIFKKATGISVVKYINQYRLEKAKSFLDESNYKINDVYRKVGFSDMSYFGMSFKKYYGVTPTQYRERCVTRETAAYLFSE